MVSSILPTRLETKIEDVLSPELKEIELPKLSSLALIFSVVKFAVLSLRSIAVSCDNPAFLGLSISKSPPSRVIKIFTLGTSLFSAPITGILFLFSPAN